MPYDDHGLQGVDVGDEIALVGEEGWNLGVVEGLALVAHQQGDVTLTVSFLGEIGRGGGEGEAHDKTEEFNNLNWYT